MRLTVETGPRAGTQVQLERGQPLTIGSSGQCLLSIPEPGIAAEHAVVKALRDEGFGVKALAAGVRVNGVEIEATPLREGDVLELGATRIRYGQQQQQHHGPRIAGFEILGELGRGGMGIVYRAEQKSLHRQVALKVLDQKLLRDPQFVARFVAEARAAAKLSHPNVVPVFDVDHDGELYYYSMELMTGSLESWLRKHGRMPVDQALRVVAEAAAGLAYAESLRIVHRDIKPDNLMLDQHGNVKIADLGLAHSDADPEADLTGTPHFMAPEQVLRRSLDHRTDLYALGCTFYRLITGRTPFRGQTVKDILRAHVKDAPEPPHKVEPSVPAEVSAIVLKLMAKEPAERFQSANDLLAALQVLLQPPARKSLWIGLAAAAVVVAGGAIYWAATRPKEQTVVERYRDNPEALRLATENEELKLKARDDAATIALLRTRLAGHQGPELAAALDAVAAAHPGTGAATEARTLAQKTRDELAAQEAARARRRELTVAALNTVQQAVDLALGKDDPGAAWRTLEAAAAPDGGDAEQFAQGIAGQRERIQQAATAQFDKLAQSVRTAHQQRDGKALLDAAARIERLLQRDGGLPSALLGDRARLERLRDEARGAAAELDSAALAGQWRDYDRLWLEPQGPLAMIRRGDFAAAAIAVEDLAARHGEGPAGARATHLAAALRRAEAVAAGLAAAAAGSQLQLPRGDEPPLSVLRWDRSAGNLIAVDSSRKPAVEQAIPVGELRAEQWRTLLQQLPGPAEEREAMLGLLALSQHVELARSFLAAIVATDDLSGTGAQGYAGNVAVFDAVLRALPADPAPWRDALREELLSARLLVSALRAFSERRNLAAASHLERLLAEHPHSMCVAALP